MHAPDLPLYMNHHWSGFFVQPRTRPPPSVIKKKKNALTWRATACQCLPYLTHGSLPTLSRAEFGVLGNKKKHLYRDVALEGSLWGLVFYFADVYLCFSNLVEKFQSKHTDCFSTKTQVGLIFSPPLFVLLLFFTACRILPSMCMHPEIYIFFKHLRQSWNDERVWNF